MSGSRCITAAQSQLSIRFAERDGASAKADNYALNAMLLNEFLKEHRKMQELEKRAHARCGSVEFIRRNFAKGIAKIILTLFAQVK
jgi:hypothetical protein